MSLQDDIFDVRDALKNLPEKQSFERIEKYLNSLEEANDEMIEFINGLKSGAKALRKLFENV